MNHKAEFRLLFENGLTSRDVVPSVDGLVTVELLHRAHQGDRINQMPSGLQRIINQVRHDFSPLGTRSKVEKTRRFLRYFLTGADSFLAENLIPLLLEQGHTVCGLSRKESPNGYGQGYSAFKGDILLSDLGLSAPLPAFDRIYHMAALLDLTNNPKVWQTNVGGTQNVLDFAIRNKIPHFVLISSAYANKQGRNVYEKSKADSESLVEAARIKKLTTFKPSIIVATPDIVGPGQSINFVATAILKTLNKMKVFQSPVSYSSSFSGSNVELRIHGDPQSLLNIVPSDIVAKAIATWSEEGKYFITNPNPPTMSLVAHEVGEATNTRVRVQENFESTPAESLLEKMIQPFLTYFREGEKFPSLLPDTFHIRPGYLRDAINAYFIECGFVLNIRNV
jgi:nucleoside-diphosphate-sugar epimerase